MSIKEELNIINDYLARPISDEPALLVERLNTLQGYLGRMPKILAECKYNTLTAKSKILADLDGLSATELKIAMEGRLAGYIALEVLADRTESALQKCIEATRSVLSFLKQTYDEY